MEDPQFVEQYIEKVALQRYLKDLLTSKLSSIYLIDCAPDKKWPSIFFTSIFFTLNILALDISVSIFWRSAPIFINEVKSFQNAGSSDNDLGDPFFLQLPSTDKMSNTSVLFQPTGFIEHDGVHFDFFLRIVTNTAGTGTIQLDGVTINALQYKRVPNSGFYYYETRTSNTTHNIQTTHFGTQFSVNFSLYGYGAQVVMRLRLLIGPDFYRFRLGADFSKSVNSQGLLFSDFTD